MNSPLDKFPTSPLMTKFRKRFFPETSQNDWNSWAWQLRNKLDNPLILNRIFTLTKDENSALNKLNLRLPVAITPYYAAVVNWISQDKVLRKTVLPTENEFNISRRENVDPLVEEKYSPVPNVVHKYPNRVLFLATTICATYCRYCTRARMAGKIDQILPNKHWQQGLEYIKNNKNIREVIISGGDPLVLQNSKLEELLRKLRVISHIQIIRLGTKIPIVLPQRIDMELTNILKKYQPIYISLHVTHPNELTTEARFAINRLVDGGMVIGSQTVLLKGVNDSLEVMKPLMENLLLNRIRPYTLFHCDRINGSQHFRTPLEKGLELVEGLRRHSCGYSLPHYVVDPPEGKVTLAPNTIMAKENNGYMLKDWKGDEVFYLDD